jgi:cell filamentation protein
MSIRFFNDREMRSVWDDELSKLRFSVLDILAVLVEKEQYVKVRN